MKGREARQTDGAMIAPWQLFPGSAQTTERRDLGPRFADTTLRKLSERESFRNSCHIATFLVLLDRRNHGVELCYSVINRINTVPNYASLSRLMWPQCSR